MAISLRVLQIIKVTSQPVVKATKGQRVIKALAVTIITITTRITLN